MLKQVSILMLSISLALTIGCTSHKANDDETAAAEGASDSVDENADLNLDSDKSTAELGSDELDLNEKLPEEKATPDTLAETAPPADTPPADATSPDALTETPPSGTDVAEAAPTPPPVEEISPTPAPTEEAAPKPAASSLKKIKSEPYHEGKTLMNAVYIARANDTWSSVSQKLYGGDKVKDLKKVNPFLKKRELKVGDKVYYNSPLRPTDDQRLLTFYEDAGVPASTYTAKTGDNLKTVGKNLLGHDRSWMELWSTNMSLESKDDLTEGTEIRYWPNSDVATPSQTVAQTELPPAEPQQMEQPPAQPDMAANDLPPPPTPPAQEEPQQQPPAAQAAVEPPPPPPPPPAPPVEQAKPKPEAAAVEPNETMALGVGAILLLAAVAMFIVIRKKKARRQLEFNTGTHTQIE